MREKLSTHRIETTRELWELVDRCARAEEGVRVPGEEEPEDKATPAKSKKRDSGPDKRVFVTEPLPKNVKPASTSDGDEDPWCHVHPDGNHPAQGLPPSEWPRRAYATSRWRDRPRCLLQLRTPRALLPKLPHQSPRR